MGAGPARLVERLGGEAVWVDAPDPAAPEIARTFAIDRRLAELVAAAVGDGDFPLVLAGQCNSALGTVAGLGDPALGVVWLDAHADFDTPDDNLSGFFDVFALSVLTGIGWRALRETIPGFATIPEERVVLAAVRDLAPYQARRLRRSAVRAVPPGEDLLGPLDALRAEAARVYLHVDLDCLDPDAAGRANAYASAGGLTLEQVVEAVGAVFERFEVAGAALTAYDPAADEDGRMLASAAAVAETIVACAQRR